MRILKENKTNMLFLPLLILSLVAIFFLIVLRINNYINSDDASELILGNLLLKEGNLLSRTWIYSTEIRLFNFALITPLVFMFTSNWFLVRVVTMIISYIILFVTLFICLKKMQLQNYFVLMAVILCCPFAWDYFNFVIVKLYYIPHIVVQLLFLLILVNIFFVKINKFQLFLYLVFIMYITTASVRYLFLNSVPLILMLIFMIVYDFIKNNSLQFINISQCIKNKLYFLYVILIGFFSVFGLVINTLLHRIYMFHSFGSIKFNAISFSRIELIINTFLTSIGYVAGKKVFSIYIFNNLFVFLFLLLIICSIIYPFKKKINVYFDLSLLSSGTPIMNFDLSSIYYIHNIYLIINLIFVFILYSISDMECSARYFIYLIVLYLINISMFIKSLNIDQILVKGFVVLFIVVLFFASFSNYKAFLLSNNDEISNVAKIILDNDCYNGYSTFINGNILTELTNGKIEAWTMYKPTIVNWKFGKNGNASNWLQVKSHRFEEAKGKAYMLLTPEEKEMVPFKNKLSEKDLFYQSNNYLLYIYDNYDLMKEILNN